MKDHLDSQAVNDRPPDPWSDAPRWSDDDAGLQAVAADVPVPPRNAASCPWCAAVGTPGSTRCHACGAALAQREAIGELVIPGLTAVDPALQDLDGRPLHLGGPSPSQGVASGLVVAAVAGGPIGLTILGGVAAVAAAEYLGAATGRTGGGGPPVGQASEAVLQALERLEGAEHVPATPDQATGLGAKGEEAVDGVD